MSTASCTFSAAFPAGRFSATPIVIATAIKAGGRDYVVTITSKTVTSVSGQVRASRTLPAVITALTALVGYDPLACTSTDLTPVDIVALPAIP